MIQLTSGERGILLNLLPDEQILYKTRAGAFSFIRRFPAKTIVATNKRLFVLNPLNIFGSYSSFSYDKISAVDVKGGILGSKFVVKIAGSEKPNCNIFFYKKGRALSTFSVVSNQVAASKDPHTRTRYLAQQLDNRYNVLSKPEQNASVVIAAEALVKFARSEKLKMVAKPNYARVFGDEPELGIPAVRFARLRQRLAPERTSVVSKMKGLGNISTITQRAYSHMPARNANTRQASINYFAAGERFTPGLEEAETIASSAQQSARTIQVQKAKLDPDKDLKIFKIRKLRGTQTQTASRWSGIANALNIFNAK